MEDDMEVQQKKFSWVGHSSVKITRIPYATQLFYYVARKKAFIKAAVLFLNLTSNVPDVREVPRQKYLRNWILGWTRSLANPSPNLAKIKQSAIWPRFSTPFAFEALWFRNRGATYRNSKTCIVCADDWPKYWPENFSPLCSIFTTVKSAKFGFGMLQFQRWGAPIPAM